jgi:raffinose/stachyose/melibiose transport system substrate-binding protein
VLPFESTTWGYLYNKKIFKDLGITPPNTLNEMKAIIAKITAAKIAPFQLAFQESWVPQLMTAQSLGGIVSSKHLDWIDKMTAGQASYNDVAGIFDIIDLINANGTKKPFEVGNEAGAADFANGKSAMWVQGPWNADAILKVNPSFEMGVAALPVSNDPKDTMINLSTSTSLAVSPTTRNKDVALDLLNYILDEKDSSALFEQLKFNPISTVHKFKVNPWVEESSAYVANGQAYQDLKLPNGVTDEQAKLLQSYYAKTVTKEQFIKTMDKTWAKAVAAAK